MSIFSFAKIYKRWEEALSLWHSANNGDEGVERGHEYLFYQTVIGTWESPPSEHYGRRIKEYMIKAVKEEKEVTGWIDPDSLYEKRLGGFVEKLLAKNSPFTEEVDRFVKEIYLPAAYNSLSALLLKATSPGVPDFYQGTELWNRRLVDPDNRGLVDFEKRAALLKELRNNPSIEEMVQDTESGLIKLYFTKTLLHLRKKLPRLFQRGSYTPIAAAGRWKDELIAYMRGDGAKGCIVVSGRFFTKLPLIEAENWKMTTLALPEMVRGKALYDHIKRREIEAGSASELPLAPLMEKIPFALLEVL